MESRALWSNEGKDNANHNNAKQETDQLVLKDGFKVSDVT